MANNVHRNNSDYMKYDSHCAKPWRYKYIRQVYDLQ